MSSLTRSRWAAIGAAVAVTLGAGGLGLVNAAGHDGGALFNTTEPCRILDTRPNFPVGGVKDDTPFGADETITIDTRGDATGQCDPLGDDVVAVALNATAALATEQTHFTFWAGDPAVVPNVSSLNPTEAFPAIPNAVTVDLDENGTFNVYNRAGQVHLIIDVIGVYTAADLDLLTNEVWGHVVDNELVGASSDDVEVTHEGDGVYCVIFHQRIAFDTTHGVQVTSASTDELQHVTVNPHPGEEKCIADHAFLDIEVTVWDTEGDPVDGDFTFFIPASGPDVDIVEGA